MYRSWVVFAAVTFALGVLVWAAGGGRVVGDALHAAHLPPMPGANPHGGSHAQAQRPAAGLPNGAAAVVRHALRGADVEREVTAGMRRIAADGDPEPAVSVLIDSDRAGDMAGDWAGDTAGDSAAVAVSAAGDCLLGRRLAGRVEVWRVPSSTTGSGRVSCSPRTALVGLGRRVRP